MANKMADEILNDLAKSKGGEDKPDGDAEDAKDGGADEEQEYSSDEDAAMQEFMDAEDAAGKAKALKAFLEICVPKIVG